MNTVVTLWQLIRDVRTEAANVASYPMLWMTRPSRNFFVLSLFLFMQVCKAKSAGL